MDRAIDPAPSSTDVERALALDTVRDAGARATFLAAVRELGRDGQAFTLERLDRLIALEDHFQSLLLYGQLDFLRHPFGASDAERDFALNVQRFWVEAANGFQRFLRNRSVWARTPEGAERMFQATGLAVSSIHCLVKWAGFLNEPGRGTPWKQLHALFALAEADGYARSAFTLRASEPAFQASVESLYVRTLLFEMLNTGNLSKVQMEIADGWLAGWSREYTLEARHQPERDRLAVDLASEAGMHLLGRRDPGANPRFLRAEAIESQIETMKAELRQGRLHAACGAGAVFPIEEHAALLAVMEKLQRSISGGGSRLDERTPFEDREVDVTAGIERVMRKVREAPGEPEAPPSPPAAVATMEMIEVSPQGLSVLATDPQLANVVVGSHAADPDVQRWRVQDLSARGYGLLADRAASDAVLLHSLVALRNHETGGWIVGNIVRKQPNRARGEVLVGIEVLGYRPIPVELIPEGTARVPAIFLPGADESGRADALLLPIGDFRAGNRYALRVGGRRYGVRLNRITGKGVDWISARFEIESKA
jgi:hypothetical protein